MIIFDHLDPNRPPQKGMIDDAIDHLNGISDIFDQYTAQFNDFAQHYIDQRVNRPAHLTLGEGWMLYPTQRHVGTQSLVLVMPKTSPIHIGGQLSINCQNQLNRLRFCYYKSSSDASDSDMCFTQWEKLPNKVFDQLYAIDHGDSIWVILTLGNRQTQWENDWLYIDTLHFRHRYLQTPYWSCKKDFTP